MEFKVRPKLGLFEKPSLQGFDFFAMQTFLPQIHFHLQFAFLKVLEGCKV